MTTGVVLGGAAEYSTNTEIIITVVVTLPTVSAALNLQAEAGIEVALPSLEATSAGVLSYVATLEVTLPVMYAELNVGQNQLGVDLPAVSAAVAGQAGVVGGISATMPRITALVGGDTTIVGSVSVLLPKVRAAATVLLGIRGAVAVQLPRARSTLFGSVGTTAYLQASLHAMESALVGFQQTSASINVTLTRIEANATNELSGEFVEAIVMNTETAALSHYTNYELNSMCEFNGVYLGAGPDGIFILDSGDTDDDTNIDALISTGDLDFGSEYAKRLTDLYIGMRSDGDMTLRISTDEGDPVEYTVSTFEVATLRQRRAKTAKGARGKYWRFELENTDGCDFELDSMNAATVSTARRI
jgi:hypothetical protein